MYPSNNEVAKREGQVFIAVKGLDDQISTLSKCIADIEIHLTSIVVDSQVVSSVNTKESIQPLLCPLAKEIVSQKDRVENLCRQISRITSSLEL